MVDYSSFTDEQLVALCQNDINGPWSELCRRYTAVARTLSFRFKVHELETDDLIQEGLVGLLSAVYSFKIDGSVSFKTYAWVCIRSRIVNAVTGLQAKKRIPADQRLSFEDGERIADTALSPEEQLVLKAETERISKVIYEKLSEKEAAVFRLYLSGNTYDEIAKQLSMSSKAVDGALQRARKKLKSELE